MKKVSLGYSDFKAFIDQNFYLIDKSLFIAEVLESSAQVIVLPRPRRFGKTLNLSMLKYFLEKTEYDNSYLFSNLLIGSHETLLKHLGQYPVIFLSFKNIKNNNWENCCQGLLNLFSELYKQHNYLLNSTLLNANEVEIVQNVINMDLIQTDLENCLYQLCGFLAKHHQQKVFILIDDYDIPIQQGAQNNFYDDVVPFMTNLLNNTLIDSTIYEKCIMTGIFPICQNKVFANIPKVCISTMFDSGFADKFGFTETEVADALKTFKLTMHADNCRKWYDYYNFSGTSVYNPWSFISFLRKSGRLIPYWVNTADSIQFEKLLLDENNLKSGLKELLLKHRVSSIIEDNFGIQDIESSNSNLWSFLLFSGYLKYEDLKIVNGQKTAFLTPTNQEIIWLYGKIIQKWLTNEDNQNSTIAMLNHLITGNIADFEISLKQLILQAFSFHGFIKDSERIYEAFFLGLTVWLREDYDFQTNFDTTKFRYDLFLKPKNSENVPIIIRLRKIFAKNRDDVTENMIKSTLSLTLDQIDEIIPNIELLQNISHDTISRIAIIFYGKDVWVEGE